METKEISEKNTLDFWVRESEKIKKELERENKNNEIYKFLEGENLVEIDKLVPPEYFINSFGKRRVKLQLTNGKSLIVSTFLFSEMLDEIVKSKNTTVKLNIVRVGKTATDTRYSVKRN